MAVCQNLVPLVNIKIAGKWMFIPLKKVLMGNDPYPYPHISLGKAWWTLGSLGGMPWPAIVLGGIGHKLSPEVGAANGICDGETTTIRYNYCVYSL